MTHSDQHDGDRNIAECWSSQETIRIPNGRILKRFRATRQHALRRRRFYRWSVPTLLLLGISLTGLFVYPRQGATEVRMPGLQVSNDLPTSQQKQSSSSVTPDVAIAQVAQKEETSEGDWNHSVGSNLEHQLAEARQMAAAIRELRQLKAEQEALRREALTQQVTLFRASLEPADFTSSYVSGF